MVPPQAGQVGTQKTKMLTRSKNNDNDSDRRPRKRHPRFLLTTSTYAHGSLGHQTSLGRPVDDQPQELPPPGRGEARREKGGGKLTDYNGAVADLTELLKLDPKHA